MQRLERSDLAEQGGRNAESWGLPRGDTVLHLVLSAASCHQGRPAEVTKGRDRCECGSTSATYKPGDLGPTTSAVPASLFPCGMLIAVPPPRLRIA